MEIKKIIERGRRFQKALLNYIDNDEECYYDSLIDLIQREEIQKNCIELQAFFCLITKISMNHYRTLVFFDKIERILIFFKIEIKQSFSNYDIFNIFKSNKRLLLFLFESGLLIPDKSLFSAICQTKYSKKYYLPYFYPEFKSMITKKSISNYSPTFNFSELENMNDEELRIFNEKRKKGENDHTICGLIQKDSLGEFIKYLTITELPLNSKIKRSIFETNSFLLNENPTLFEYAAFYGSNKIFNYLLLNKFEIEPSIWNFAVHGNSAFIIHSLEEQKIELNDADYVLCMFEAIKSHNFNIIDYLINNFMEQWDDVLYYQPIIKSYNYELFPENLNDGIAFYYLCQYGYSNIVKLLVNETRLKMLNFELVFLLI